jgi:chromate transporter
MIHLTLFLEFFKIGLFSVGGGLATIPFLQEMVEKYHWITSQDLLDIIAIAESTPGPIGINAATFVGYKAVGITGGIMAVIGIVTPSIIIIILISKALEKFKQSPLVEHGFYGIRPVVAGLILAAGMHVAQIALIDIRAYSVLVIAFIAIKKIKVHPILYIIGGAIIGMILKM